MTPSTDSAAARSARPTRIRLLVDGLPTGQRPGAPAPGCEDLPPAAAAVGLADEARMRYATGQRRGLVPSNLPFEAWAALYRASLQSDSATSRA